MFIGKYRQKLDILNVMRICYHLFNQRISPFPEEMNDYKGKDFAMINLELSKEELSLIKMLLRREELSTRIEIHHARRTFEYRDYLKTREKEIRDLLEKIQSLLPDEA